MKNLFTIMFALIISLVSIDSFAAQGSARRSSVKKSEQHQVKKNKKAEKSKNFQSKKSKRGKKKRSEVI